MYLLTRAEAQKAIELATPTILFMMDEGVVNNPHLHVIVARIAEHTTNGFLTLAEQSFGEQGDWVDNYDNIARMKTKISARTGLTSRQVQRLHPELLVYVDVMYWGNAVLGNLIVSCSGVQPWFDEAISNTVAWLCLALTQEKVEGLLNSAGGNTYNS
jgi:hypothetical protein